MLIISQQGMTIVSLQVTGDREWYEDETISVDKNGINGTITQVGVGSFNDTTIMVNKTGLVGTTIEI